MPKLATAFPFTVTCSGARAPTRTASVATSWVGDLLQRWDRGAYVVDKRLLLRLVERARRPELETVLDDFEDIARKLQIALGYRDALAGAENREISRPRRSERTQVTVSRSQREAKAVSSAACKAALFLPQKSI